MKDQEPRDTEDKLLILTVITATVLALAGIIWATHHS